MQPDYDIVIIGGGLVGASLACALGYAGVRIAVVEAVPLDAEEQPSFDERTLALSYGSRRIFEGLGIWESITALGVTPIRKIHVTDRGHPGFMRMDCRREGVEALGYVARSRILGLVLARRLPELERVRFLCPARLESLDCGEPWVRVGISDDTGEHTLTASLVVGADGVRSTVRDIADIRTLDLDYGQTAIITTMETERFHDYTAYERFTPGGPLAVLPLSNAAQDEHGHRSAVVRTVPNGQVDSMMAMNDEEFLGSLQDSFGYRLGRIWRTGNRVAYPLVLRRAREHVRHRLALIGNAAHTLHPVAGQGFNLGLRDVAALAQVIVEALREQRDPGSRDMLRRYADWRRRDHLRVTAFTDSLVRLFSNSFPPAVLTRNLGLLATDLLPPVKRMLVRQAMGISGSLPRLARGIPLQQDVGE